MMSLCRRRNATPSCSNEAGSMRSTPDQSVQSVSLVGFPSLSNSAYTYIYICGSMRVPCAPMLPLSSATREGSWGGKGHKAIRLSR